MSITTQEARERFKLVTKRVLSPEAKKSFRAGEKWETEGGYPIVSSLDGKFVIRFNRLKNGTVYAFSKAIDQKSNTNEP